ARDGSAVEQQADGLPPLRVGAAGELVALAGDLGGDRGDGVVDEGRDRAAGDIEQLAQLLRVGAEREADLYPEPERDSLTGAVGVKRGLVEPAANQVAG